MRYAREVIWLQDHLLGQSPLGACLGVFVDFVAQ